MSVDQLHDKLEVFAGYLWGWPMLVLLVATGVWFTFVLKGLQFRLLFPALYDAFGPDGGKSRGEGTISNRAALLTALAATVGTGNIAGVATAIAMGGPGAVFWMWLSGLLGMAVKFSEVLLGLHYRVREADGTYRGGPMYYLKQGVGSPFLAGVFATFLAFATLSIGGMIQNNSIADALNATFGWNATLVGGVVAIAAAVIMFGGLKSIANTANVLVPVMIIAYTVAAVMILLANASYVPEVFGMIFHDAFSGSAAAGGFAGVAMASAVRFGLSRGVFSNESGQGSAPIVAATAKTRHPAEQALISMTQTFIDTIVVCTMTALVILVSGAWQSGAAQSAGASLTTLAFNTGLGQLSFYGVGVGAAIVSVSILMFAFTTILGWGFYGQQAAVYLLGPKVAKPYLAVFLVFTFLGAYLIDYSSAGAAVRLLWVSADITVGLTMLPNLYALWMLSGKIRALTEDYLSAIKTGRAFAVVPFVNEVRVSARPAKGGKTLPMTRKKMVVRRPKAAKRRR
ncbi:MAG: amino acid carrier protein [Proteobacteria bacterium]|nr:amino acid carrier protein [Pseudomonadota bacterium]